MKKLGILSINLNKKVIKNEELVNLKGGYGSGSCYCQDSSGYVHFEEQATFPDCTPEYVRRWVETNCWPEHQAYSGCNCY